MAPKILVIEDEPSIADTLLYALQKEGYAVTWRSLLSEASQFLEQAAVDFIILDVGLPDGNGFDFCRTLRKSSQVPVLFLTARSEEIDRVVGLEIGGDDYLVKPFSPRELVARVRAVLRRQTGAVPLPAQPKTDLPFVVQKEKMQITYFGQLLNLSRYEYLILEALIAAPGRVFSRDQLMEKLWDDPGSSLDRTIDAHIKNLRAELKRIKPESDAILTHRGTGYALKETW